MKRRTFLDYLLVAAVPAAVVFLFSLTVCPASEPEPLLAQATATTAPGKVLRASLWQTANGTSAANVESWVSLLVQLDSGGTPLVVNLQASQMPYLTLLQSGDPVTVTLNSTGTFAGNVSSDKFFKEAKMSPAAAAATTTPGKVLRTSKWLHGSATWVSLLVQVDGQSVATVVSDQAFANTSLTLLQPGDPVNVNTSGAVVNSINAKH